MHDPRLPQPMRPRTSTLVQEPPSGPWLRIWLAGGLVSLVALVALEVTWRRQGHRAAMVASPDLWCHHRARCRGAGPETLVLLGSSRIQAGFDQATFLELHPECEVVQLALTGSGPTSVLRDLARDESFRGTVLCSVHAATIAPRFLPDQSPQVEYYEHQWGPGKALALRLIAPLQERFVVLQPHLSVRRYVLALFGAPPPQPPVVSTRFDRTLVADYGSMALDRMIDEHLAQVRAHFERHETPTRRVWREVVTSLAADVRRIEARGGRVAFVRYPSSGRHRELEDATFPRNLYWDVFAAEIGTVAIHFEDLVDLAELRLPDESHLDEASARLFTRRLVVELEERGVLASGAARRRPSTDRPPARPDLVVER